MKKIVAPVDFSPVSKNAALYAANLAALLDLPLVLFHVTEIPVLYGELPAVPLNYNALSEAGNELLEKLADELDEKLLGQVAIETVVRVGNPIYELTGYAARHIPYAIVMSTKGAGVVERFLLGSTTRAVIRDCHCPIIIVPNDYTFGKPHKIGLASDLHNVASTTPADLIGHIVDDLGARLEILHVEKDDEEQETVQVETEELSNMFDGQHPKFRFLKSIFTEETLLNYVHEKHYDLLIVVPKKHNWLDTLLKHQHTNHLALHAPVPVMVVKTGRQR